MSGTKAEGDELKAKGNDCFKKKDFNNAINWYTQAIEKWDKDHTYFSNRSACYDGIGDYANAAEDGRSCIRVNKQFIKGYFRLATALEKQGLYQEAVNAIIGGLAVEPRNKDLLTMKSRCEEQIRKEKSRNLQAQSESLLKQGDLQGAYKALESARAIDSDNAALQRRFQEVQCEYEAAEKARRAGLSGPERLKEQGDDKYKAGMFEEAITLYTRCINESSPGNATTIKALSNRSACYKQLSNFDNTIEDCTTVLEYEPDNVKALVRRAQAFEAVERYKLALQDVKYVISLGANVAGLQNYKLCNQMQTRLARVIDQLKSGNY